MIECLVNGERTQTISVRDRGFHYGDGLFETVLVENNKPVYLKEHLERLSKGCRVLGLPAIDIDKLKAEVNDVIANHLWGVVKIMVTRGESNRGYAIPETVNVTRVVSFTTLEASTIKDELQTVNITLCEMRLSQQPRLAGLKHLNQLERVLARSEWNNTDCFEGLMLDMDDNVIEGTMSNVFIVKNGELLTSPLHNAGVKGIMRDKVIKLADKRGINCHRGLLSLDDVISADEVFITNSVILLKAVAQLCFLNRIVDYTQNAISTSLYAAVAEDIRH